jgi:quercetin dioxygenase-like cupin family protein
MPVREREPSVGILVAGEETGGRFALVETVEEKGARLPFHRHNREDETLYVLEGSLNVWIAGKRVYAPAGAAVFLPRGVEHAHAVATETARMLVYLVPSGCEDIYREVGAPGTSSLDVERLVATAARYGCEITGPFPEVAG